MDGSRPEVNVKVDADQTLAALVFVVAVWFFAAPVTRAIRHALHEPCQACAEAGEVRDD